MNTVEKTSNAVNNERTRTAAEDAEVNMTEDDVAGFMHRKSGDAGRARFTDICVFILWRSYEFSITCIFVSRWSRGCLIDM